jgi:hypothetical protein
MGRISPGSNGAGHGNPLVPVRLEPLVPLRQAASGPKAFSPGCYYQPGLMAF